MYFINEIKMEENGNVIVSIATWNSIDVTNTMYTSNGTVEELWLSAHM